MLIALVAAGCGLDRGGLRRGRAHECSDVDFSVTPQYICPGEPVTIQWSVADVLFVPCDRFFDFDLGEDCIVGIAADTTGILQSIPERIFDGSTMLTRVAPSLVRVVYPMLDTDIRLTVFRNDDFGHRMFCESITLPVYVIEWDEINYYPMTFPFSCTGAGGGPGWGPIAIERGEVTSSSIRIHDVRNYSPFPVRVSVRRDTEDLSIPPLVTVDLEAHGNPGDTTMEIEGEFFGDWTAVPLDPESFDPSGCDADGMAGDVMMPPGGDSPVLAPLPAVELSVALEGCTAEAMSLPEEALPESADESVFEDPVIDEEAWIDESPIEDPALNEGLQAWDGPGGQTRPVTGPGNGDGEVQPDPVEPVNGPVIPIDGGGPNEPDNIGDPADPNQTETKK